MMQRPNPYTSDISWTAIALAVSLGLSPQAIGQCPEGPTLAGSAQHCSSNQTGKVGDYGWSIWSSGGGGCITTYTNSAAFKATWNNSGDFLARVGYQWDETKTYEQYGTLTADYAYTKTGSAGGYSFVGIYGWSNNPLIEFYIVDDWYGSSNPPTAGGSLKGSFTADSGTYKIYTNTRVNQPSIHGNTTFTQFFSIRQKQRQCGHISITEHFNEWKKLNMNLGKMYEAKLLIEAGGGMGSIDYSYGSMTWGEPVQIALRPGRNSWSKNGRVFTEVLGVNLNDVMPRVTVDGKTLQVHGQEWGQSWRITFPSSREIVYPK